MYLETAYLFHGISAETRAKILAAAVEESHQPGEYLFRQGEPAIYFCILQEGRVRLSVGEKGLLAYVASASGDIMGWSSLAENPTYTASAECRTPVKVLKLDKQRLDEILTQDCVSGMAFFKNLAALIGRRLVGSYQATLSVHGDRAPGAGG
jgi:CRP/FNR family cyclic AMP-dependent transcriptional regulator